MERLFKAPLLDGYDYLNDKTGDFKEFVIENDSWNRVDNPPTIDGEYLLAVWDGYEIHHDICYFEEGEFHITNDWYEGEPIAYIAWMDIHTIRNK